MQTPPTILSQLNDHDIGWLAANGQRRHIADGTVLLREGQPAQEIFVLLEGTLAVFVGGKQVDWRSIPGEVVGEMSFIDARMPVGTVQAKGDAFVLAVPRHRLSEQLSSTPGFSARFYRAVALLLSQRLRTQLGRQEGGRWRLEASATTLNFQRDERGETGSEGSMAVIRQRLARLKGQAN